MFKNLVIIKIGGSVITDKSKIRNKYRKEVVSNIVKQIAEAKRKQRFNLIIIHGAGAYPHYLTSKYRISEGVLNDKSTFGFSHVKKEAFKLNNYIWGEFLKQRLTACTIQPSAVIITENGKIKSFNTKPIETLLRLGISPIMMGDDTLDERTGIMVFSGDTILSYLGKKFKASKIIYVSDINGVFDKNPKIYKTAKLIKEIDSQNIKLILNSLTSLNKYDTTGEIKGKLLAIKSYLKNFDVYIVNGLKKNTLKQVFTGKNPGTLIKL